MSSIIRGNDDFDSAKLAGSSVPTDVKASRAINTDYTNSSGGTRVVYINGNNGTAGCEIQVSFNSGSTWMPVGGSFLPSGIAQAYVTVLVPDGATYRFRSSTGTLTVSAWWEQ